MSGAGNLPDIPEVARAGMVAAAAAAASLSLLVVMLDPGELTGLAISILLIGLPVALLHVWLVAMPLYFALRRRWLLCWWNAALGGLLVGIIPSALLILPRAVGAPLSDAGATPDGDLRILLAALLPGLPGLIGGLAFWARLPRSGSCR